MLRCFMANLARICTIRVAAGSDDVSGFAMARSAQQRMEVELAVALRVPSWCGLNNVNRASSSFKS